MQYLEETFLCMEYNIETMLFSSESERDIYFGTPFYGKFKSVQNINTIALLDLNIIDDIRKGNNQNNLLKLFEYCAKNDIESTPAIALLEQVRTHGNPKFAFDNYINSLKERFSFNIPESEEKKVFTLINDFGNFKIDEHINMLKSYIVILKYVNTKKVSFDVKVKQFIGLIDEHNIPFFTFAFFLGCSMLHIQANQQLYDKKLVSKTRKDLNIGSNIEKESLNLASDLFLIMSVSELFHNNATNEYNFSYIATGDLLIAHALKTIRFAGIKIINGRKFPIITIMPETDFYNDMIKHIDGIEKLSKKINFSRSNKKAQALKRLTEQLIKRVETI